MARHLTTRTVPQGSGLGSLALGAVMAAAGGYMLASRAYVTSVPYDRWSFYGYSPYGHSSFGLSLLPFVIGVGLVFFGRPLLGWVLVACGLAMVGAGLLMTLHLNFVPTTLYEFLAMAALLMAGVGLIAKVVVTFARYGV